LKISNYSETPYASLSWNKKNKNVCAFPTKLPNLLKTSYNNLCSLLPFVIKSCKAIKKHTSCSLFLIPAKYLFLYKNISPKFSFVDKLCYSFNDLKILSLGV